ncbi:rhodanese-like domain-containing protein [soil metagenome]
MTPIREVDVHQAAELAAIGAVLLDVREPDEWRAGHVADAVHQPLGGLNPASIGLGTRIVAVCRSGNRSGKAAVELARAGHDVVNMRGGMLAWSKAGLPMVDDGGEPGTV